MTTDGHLPKSIGETPLSKVLDEKIGMPSVILISPEKPLIRAVRLMNVYNISQIPVIEKGEVVGNISEASVMRNLYKGVDSREAEVRAVMTAPLPRLDQSAEVSEAYEAFSDGAPAVVVIREGRPFGVLTRTDLIAYWAFQSDRLHYHI